MCGCGRKVFLSDKNNNDYGSIVRHVLGKTRITLKVKLASNGAVSIKRPQFDKEFHVHCHGTTQNNVRIDDDDYI